MTTTTPTKKLRYTVGVYGEEDGKPTLCRDDDGSLTIMLDAGTDDSRPALKVPRIHMVKKKNPWRARYAEQKAFAQHVCDLLNAAEEV